MFRSKYFRIKRAIFIPIAKAASVFVFGSLIMFLWNTILPALFEIATITFWQALGILVLSKMLLGGFGCRQSHSGHSWKSHPMNLNPAEREKMKEEWRNRCNTQPKAE